MVHHGAYIFDPSETPFLLKFLVGQSKPRDVPHFLKNMGYMG